MILIENFSFDHCKLSFNSEGMKLNFKYNGDYFNSSVQLCTSKMINQLLGC